MTLKEFADKNPDLIKKAEGCKSLEEFEKFAKEHGVEIAKEKLKEAYSYVRAQAGGELKEDALEGVAGGTKYKSGQWANGDVYTNLTNPKDIKIHLK